MEVSPKETSSFLKYRELVNRIQENLRNSLFKQYSDDYNLVGKTRYQSKKLGVKKVNEKSPVVGYKMQDIEILQMVLHKAVICRHCASKKSKMNILQQPSLRKAE